MRAISRRAAFGDACSTKRRTVGADDHDGQRDTARGGGGGGRWARPIFCGAITHAVEKYEPHCGNGDHDERGGDGHDHTPALDCLDPGMPRAARSGANMVASRLRAARGRRRDWRGRARNPCIGRSARSGVPSASALSNRPEAGVIRVAGNRSAADPQSMLADHDRRIGMLKRWRAGEQLKAMRQARTGRRDLEPYP